MSAATVKRQFERFLLDQFLVASQIAAEVVDDCCEAPDFIIQVDQGLLGVEITELFSPHDGASGPLQGQESISKRIIARASAIYRASGAQHAHVSVHFSPGSDLRKLNRDQTAMLLADFVQSQMLLPGQIVQWRPDYVTKSLPEAITFVNMLGVTEPSMAHWSSPSAGWISPLTKDIMQARVDEKAALLPKYAQRVPSTWLLLVSDGAKPSQFFDVPTDEDASTIVSPFARTFYFGRFKRIVMELGAARLTRHCSGRPPAIAEFGR